MCFNPIALVWLSCLGWGIGLVNESTTLSSVWILHIFTSFLSMISRITSNFLRMCLDFWCDLGSLAWTMAPLLSQYRSTPLYARNYTKFSNELLNPNPFLCSSEAARYSASVVESATVLCFKLFQLIAHPFRRKTNPDWDRKSSLSIWKLAST